MKSASYYLIGAILPWVAFHPNVSAQGLLPKTSTSTPAAVELDHPLLIGETVPESLTVLGENGKMRTLLSYKAPTELLVAVFFSLPCSPAEAQWPEFRRLDERYKDWRVAFLAVSLSTPESISTALAREKLPWPNVSDEHKTVAAALRITASPEVLIMDEYGVLRYRGPLASARIALDAVIGHIDPVKDPEPAFAGCSL